MLIFSFYEQMYIVIWWVGWYYWNAQYSLRRLLFLTGMLSVQRILFCFLCHGIYNILPLLLPLKYTWKNKINNSFMFNLDFTLVFLSWLHKKGKEVFIFVHLRKTHLQTYLMRNPTFTELCPIFSRHPSIGKANTLTLGHQFNLSRKGMCSPA